MVAVDKADQERVITADGVKLDVDVKFDVEAIVLVRVRHEVDPRNVAKWGFVVRVDGTDTEAVFKELFVHYQLNELIL